MFPLPISGEQLQIGSSFYACTRAWWPQDDGLSVLWTGADAIGNDLAVAGGRTISRRKRLPVWKVPLPMAIGSSHAPDGTPHANRLTGLEANIDEMMEVVELLTEGGGTHDLILTRASGATWGEECHVLGLSLGGVRPSGVKSAALKLSIAAGRLVPLS